MGQVKALIVCNDCTLSLVTSTRQGMELESQDGKAMLQSGHMSHSLQDKQEYNGESAYMTMNNS